MLIFFPTRRVLVFYIMHVFRILRNPWHHTACIRDGDGKGGRGERRDRKMLLPRAKRLLKLFGRNSRRGHSTVRNDNRYHQRISLSVIKFGLKGPRGCCLVAKYHGAKRTAETSSISLFLRIENLYIYIKIY